MAIGNYGSPFGARAGSLQAPKLQNYSGALKPLSDFSTRMANIREKDWDNREKELALKERELRQNAFQERMQKDRQSFQAGESEKTREFQANTQDDQQAFTRGENQKNRNHDFDIQKAKTENQIKLERMRFQHEGSLIGKRAAAQIRVASNAAKNKREAEKRGLTAYSSVLNAVGGSNVLSVNDPYSETKAENEQIKSNYKTQLSELGNTVKQMKKENPVLSMGAEKAFFLQGYEDGKGTTKAEYIRKKKDEYVKNNTYSKYNTSVTMGVKDKLAKDVEEFKKNDPIYSQYVALSDKMTEMKANKPKLNKLPSKDLVLNETQTIDNMKVKLDRLNEIMSFGTSDEKKAAKFLYDKIDGVYKTVTDEMVKRNTSVAKTTAQSELEKQKRASYNQENEMKMNLKDYDIERKELGSDATKKEINELRAKYGLQLL